MPASSSASTAPATSGASGPTTTRSAPASRAAATIPGTSSAPTGRHSTWSRAMPALPGAQSTSGRCGLRSRARTRACSRPPPPTTRTRFTRPAPGARATLASERGDEVVHGDGDERLVARRTPRPELERYAGHGLLVRRLHDVDKVVVAEHGPLRLHARAQLLDLLVHLAQPRRVVLERLNPLGSQRAEHHEGGH